MIGTDGGDNASRYTLRDIKKLVVERDVQIYAIGLFETFFFNTLEEKLGKTWLREITERTGGRTVTVLDRAKLPDVAGEISRELRNEYVLGFACLGKIQRTPRGLGIRFFVPSPRAIRLPSAACRRTVPRRQVAAASCRRSVPGRRFALRALASEG